MFDIQEELKKLPAKPGVYIMHDAKDAIIYVGKAISLRNRVRQYFQSSRNLGVKKEQMVQQIARFEYIITDSELEALVLECNLIKEHRPKYNTMLKDDKGYPYIRVTVQEDFPRVVLARQMKKDKSRYFGPYTSVGAVKESMELMRKLYFVRNCSRNLPRDIGKERPCLYYHIHQCKAPCQGYVSKEEYRKNIDGVLDFLNGDYKKLVKELEGKMQAAAGELRFEEAGEYRDLIQNIEKIGERQKITGSTGEDKDVIALACDETDAVVQVFFIRDGKMIGRDHFYLRVAVETSRSQILQDFVKQFYAGTPFVPKVLMLQEEVEEIQVLEEWLTKKRGQRVHIQVPKKGTKEKLVELAARNAQMVLSQDREKLKREEGRTIGAMKEIAALLGLEDIERVESYDISNISGFESVGSMVVYEKGKPKRNDYRKFKIRTVKGPDDYASMQEVLTRRFQRGLDEKENGREDGKFNRFPDLILMDGGKGQVHVACQVLEELHLQIPVCGMVKDDSHRTRGLYYQDREIPISHSSEGFKLITRIQDEVHRFAIEYHRLLRSKGQIHSILDDIDGIGPARRKALMRQFKSLEAIQNAQIDQLKAVPSMNEAAARQVYAFFHEEPSARENP
ncbi:MAG TPA: excinuclease ABC subunit UvrC [Candidatus Pullilachnospira stercoravium]|uniref:UvrABC system protein C n=1 Tax=Candidatus Pullilachnospira stercoravium TaxID=2840913 RepID=A0A9D1NWT6_9FIRM|nr:excinuclease ABC subunit UvrC [Candidatus Pullilachnospira stercoravium]